jgi:hypothetical protein
MAGVFSFTVSVSGSGGTTQQPFTLDVAPANTSAAAVTGTESTLFQYPITSTDQVTGYSAENLPSWLTLDSTTGVLFGTPPAAGSFQIVVDTIGPGGSDPKSVTIDIQAVLTVDVTAGGTVLGLGGSTALADVNTSFNLSASPNPGFFFGGWSGTLPSLPSFANSLSIDLTGNTTVAANFASFASMQGSYSGLISSTPASNATAGSASFTLNSHGSYSGSILLGGASYKMHGSFDPSGTAPQIPLKLPGGTAATLILQLQTAAGFQNIAGQLMEDGTTVATLSAPRSFYNKKNPWPYPGKYTVLLNPGNGAPEAPAGIGYGTVSVTAFPKWHMALLCHAL